MTQRPKQQISLLPDLHYVREKSKEKPSSVNKKQRPASGCHNKRTTSSMKKEEQSNQQLIKKSTTKQQNIPSPVYSPSEFIQYSASDDSPLVEVMVKHSKQIETPRQRSKSTVSTREPWSQLLKKQKSGKQDSVFSNFDPLRSLHFLAKELQINLQALLPGDKGVQEILSAIQNALKRVPPEVASTIHLQQTIELLPSSRKSTSSHGLDDMLPEKLSKSASKKTQTDFDKDETESLQKLMEENTLKLEASCRHLENIGQQLKSDKLYLETQLQNEKASSEFFRRRVEDVEEVNRELVNKITKKDEELKNLQCEIINLKSKIDENVTNKTEVEYLVNDLKQSKSSIDQECSKLKHQLRLCAIEKEKYLAILAVRDRQINEIKNEMTQLQQVVNDQLVELNSNALAAMPSSASIAALWKTNQNKENMGDGTISSIHDEGEINQENKQNGFQSGDSDIFQNLPVNNRSDNVRRLFASTDDKIENEIPVFSEIDKYSSKTSTALKDMFCELKKQAYMITEPYK